MLYQKRSGERARRMLLIFHRNFFGSCVTDFIGPRLGVGNSGPIVKSLTCSGNPWNGA